MEGVLILEILKPLRGVSNPGSVQSDRGDEGAGITF
jgi:hypothetical protein